MVARLKNYHLAGFVFFLIHVAVLGVFFVPFRRQLLLWLLISYAVRMFGVTAGYHRYFSHRSYKMGRIAQFLMAFLAQTSAQKGVLWWAAHHREHHQYSDRDRDVHSPLHPSFWWSHVGWVISTEHDAYDPRRIADFGKYPELRWLDRWHWIPATALGVGVYCLGGWSGFFWGFMLSTVILYHCTFSINSIAHLWGTRRFDTPDNSRNNWLLALLTLGEGWHNNHHYVMSSCGQGYRWWELDITYYLLRLLGVFGIAYGIRPYRLPATAERVTA